MLEKELIDTYKYLRNDTATKIDSLGFKPYVEAIAEFLTAENTCSPLTLSIEGQWGCGKSSFMKQLKDEIKNVTLPKKIFTICFNSWRFDKEDELWAAFVLTLMDQLSKQLSWQDRQYAKINLIWLRLKFKWESDSSVIINILWIIFRFILITMICVGILYYGPNIIEILFSHTKDDNYIKISTSILLALAAFVGFISNLLSFSRNSKILDNPFDLVRTFQSSNYKEHLPFIENFHSDFNKIVKSFAGKSRVYVFIDDLDRCEIPKAAELMKAINLMISDNPNIYFIIGMDRKLIAAGIASKQKEFVNYLTDDKLKYGYEFIEKFIQFPFKVPSPKNIEYKEFLFAKDDSKELIEKIRKFVLGEKTLKEGTEVKINEMDEFGGNDCYELSETFENIMKMISPALDNNPRRLKQFHNMFRFYKYIGRRTGLFYMKGDKYNVWNCKKLAKYIAISIMWPSVISALNSDRTLLDYLQNIALNEKLGHSNLEVKYSEEFNKLLESSAYSGKFILDERLIELLSEGCIEDGEISKDKDEYTLSKLDFSKLLDISPVGSFNLIKYFYISSTVSSMGSSTATVELLDKNTIIDDDDEFYQGMI